MGTSIQVQAFGGDEAARLAAIDEAFAAFAEIDRLMSNYRDDSELTRLNRDGARDAVAVSEPMFAVLDAARRVSAASSGAFDITVGPLVRLWGFHDKAPHIPTDLEFAAVRPLVDYRGVLLDAEHRTAHFARPGVELTCGSPKASLSRSLRACGWKRTEWFSRRGRQSVCRARRPASANGRSVPRVLTRGTALGVVDTARSGVDLVRLL
jgi:hypothetical protein